MKDRDRIEERKAIENNRMGYTDEAETARQIFWKGILWGIVFALFVASVIIIIYRTVNSKEMPSNQEYTHTAEETVADKETLEKLEELAELVDDYYYEEIDAQAVRDGVYNGLLSSMGDPYSQYYNKEDYQALMETTTGNYCGIGVVLTQNQDTMEVIILHAYEGAPAYEAGVKDGDMVLAVDGVPVDGEELSELVKRIKGDEGTYVQMVVQRENGQQLEFRIERRKIQVPTVEYEMLEDTVGFIQISEFSDVTVAQFEEAVEELEQQGMTAMIVDLRDNPGGVLDGVCEILDQILPEGILVYTEDKYGNRENYMSEEESYMEIPIAVLINENSASAAEIFAGAIQDFEYGTLIGTTTFGKGIVQQIIPLEDGSAAKLTIARYFTPKGNYIHEVGIQPDIELEYEYLSTETEEYDPLFDNQVLKALEVLQE